MSASKPSYNPSDAGSLQGVLSFVVKKFVQGNLDGMLPAMVNVYDQTLNQAAVQPMIQVVSTDGTQISRAALASIPVLALGCGTGLVRFKLQQGDLGWIIASDRDISLYMQSLKESPPNTDRMHSFSDALFVPDKVRGYIVNALDNGADIILQTADGTCAVSIFPDAVKIRASTEIDATAGTSITLTAPTITLAGQIVGTSGLELAGDATIGGDATITGKFGCNGQPAQSAVSVNAPATTNAQAIALVNQLRALLIANGQAT